MPSQELPFNEAYYNQFISYTWTNFGIHVLNFIKFQNLCNNEASYNKSLVYLHYIRLFEYSELNRNANCKMNVLKRTERNCMKLIKPYAPIIQIELTFQSEWNA